MHSYRRWTPGRKGFASGKCGSVESGAEARDDRMSADEGICVGLPASLAAVASHRPVDVVG